jgi:H+-translocating NAD(P) transhydrogenase subunit alpha
MKIAIPTEVQAGESRVAASPDTVKAYVKKGAEVVVQSGAGLGAFISDDAFAAAGAKITTDGFGDPDIVLTVRRPSDKLLKSLKPGVILAGGLEPYGDKAGLEAIAKSGVTAFAMELMPRITRAQSMDILSSQANLAGYKAVIDAAAHYSRAFPMMMTAAGTVPPAKVFIMGVGVAGLQAIATARRLGAIVSATDVRKATEEQVKSLGAKFVFADVADAATSGGYAKELSAEDKAKQAALVAEHIDPFVFQFAIFVLAIFVGYYVVWSVTPALHTPLMSVTNAISSVIVVGALLAVGVGARHRDSGHSGPCLRLHRADPRLGEHLRRLPRHPAHARHVQEEGLRR